MPEQASTDNKSTRDSFRWVLCVIITIVFAGVVIFLLPGLYLGPHGDGHKMTRAKKELVDIELAIQNYYADYSGMPVTAETAKHSNGDFTYGTAGLKLKSGVQITNTAKAYQANNAEVVAILLDDSNSSFNKGHINNLNKKQYLQARIADEDGKPGVGPTNGVFLDPWGNPYIISLDLSGDGWTQDAFYSRRLVSQKAQGMTNSVSRLVSPSGQTTNDFSFHGRVMVWSLGPDGKADPNIPADEGVNEDNILSWY